MLGFSLMAFDLCSLGDTFSETERFSFSQKLGVNKEIIHTEGN
jgi:hypothetical protein